MRAYSYGGFPKSQNCPESSFMITSTMLFRNAGVSAALGATCAFAAASCSGGTEAQADTANIAAITDVARASLFDVIVSPPHGS
jgi:hypothetical protein